MRPTGRDAVALAELQLGQRYAHVVVPKADRAYRGPFDCAELASWVYGCLLGRVIHGERFFGCSSEAGGDDAYSGFWIDDGRKYGAEVTIEEAAQIPGAVLLRRARPGKMGHVALSTGDGGTIEAHSKALGVARRGIAGRVWDLAVLVPDVDYTPAKKEG